MSLLKIQNLSISFYVKQKKITALDKVSLSIEKGEVFGIAGESGSGKTTLGLSVLNLLSENAVIEKGKIFYKDTNLFNLNEKNMNKIRGSQISLIFQDPLNALNPVYTVGFQVGETIRKHQNIRNKKILRQKILDVFSMVNLKDPINIIDSYPHQLSGGMRQRVMIAQAISCNPSLLIADEPTSNLDVTIQKNILDLFKQLNKKLGLSIILISHDLDLIRYICNKVAIINKGRVEEEGSSEFIFSSPERDYTKKLVESAQFFKD